MCTKEKVTTEQKTLTVFRKGYVRKNDRIRSFFNSFLRRRYAGSLTPIRTWATSAPRHFGTRTVRHQETGAEVFGHFGTSFFWCRTVSRSLRTGAEVSLCLNTYKTAKGSPAVHCPCTKDSACRICYVGGENDHAYIC